MLQILIVWMILIASVSLKSKLLKCVLVRIALESVAITGMTLMLQLYAGN